MNDIQRTLSSSISLIPASTPTNAKSLSDSFPDIEAIGADLNISAEGQYFFEVDTYLTEPDESKRKKVLDFLSQSSDPLQKKAVDYFKQSQEVLSKFTQEQRQDVLVQSKLRDALGKPVLHPDFVDSEATRIVVYPQALEVFRLDKNEHFDPITLGKYNTQLIDKFNALEPVAYDQLDNQDAANLIGAVRFALDASENILTSLDDVLHLNYSVQKAKDAISLINAPDDMKAQLTDLLNQGLAYQNEKQARFIEDTKHLVSDTRVRVSAAEDVRLAKAAQKYNIELQSTLNASNLSVLDAGGLFNKLLTNNSDLIRFSPSKITEALSFYKKDLSSFQKALNRDFSQLEPELAPVIDKSVLEAGSKYALGVIKQIEAYMSKPE